MPLKQAPSSVRRGMIRPMDEKKHCRDCGRVMWFSDISGFGPLWHCTACHQSAGATGDTFAWKRPRVETTRSQTPERKYRSHHPCPRCGQRLWTVEVPDYGSRQQCEDCRISIVSGSIMEWRSAKS